MIAVLLALENFKLDASHGSRQRAPFLGATLNVSMTVLPHCIDDPADRSGHFVIGRLAAHDLAQGGLIPRTEGGHISRGQVSRIGGALCIVPRQFGPVVLRSHLAIGEGLAGPGLDLDPVDGFELGARSLKLGLNFRHRARKPPNSLPPIWTKRIRHFPAPGKKRAQRLRNDNTGVIAAFTFQKMRDSLCHSDASATNISGSGFVA
ncbi:MAG: hypothetical protein KDJ71_11265 [Nitrobacter sp.]|nr:hypothetical protein [Nitrobacter sp.]MCB1393759.1 hypothetical protein [Nitrobacter sp.]